MLASAVLWIALLFASSLIPFWTIGVICFGIIYLGLLLSYTSLAGRRYQTFLLWLAYSCFCARILIPAFMDLYALRPYPRVLTTVGNLSVIFLIVGFIWPSGHRSARRQKRAEEVKDNLEPQVGQGETRAPHKHDF